MEYAARFHEDCGDRCISKGNKWVCPTHGNVKQNVYTKQ